MRIEPEEHTLFPFEKDIDGDSFRIRIALWPALIYIFLLGATIAAFHISRIEAFLTFRFVLLPVVYLLWSIFLLLSFLTTISYFTTKISVYTQRVTGRGVFLFAYQFDIKKDQIESVQVKQSPLGEKMHFGTLIIKKKVGRICIPWVEKPQNAKSALDAIYSLK